MDKVEEELTRLKLMTDQDEMKQIYDKQMRELKQTLDFFREQALELEKKYDEVKKAKIMWRAKAEGLESDVEFLENLASKMREEIKYLRDIGSVNNPILNLISPKLEINDDILTPTSAMNR
jgi:chromosome segregation ATPase